MKIKYVLDRSLTNLERKVNDYLSQGWTIVGELKTFNGSYVQPILKYPDDFWAEDEGQTKLTDFEKEE